MEGFSTRTYQIQECWGERERERESSKREKVLGRERTGQGREISRERKRERQVREGEGRRCRAWGLNRQSRCVFFHKNKIK